MAQRKVAMQLRGPGRKVYTGYCVYDQNDQLIGWMLRPDDAKFVEDMNRVPMKVAAAPKKRKPHKVADVVIAEAEEEPVKPPESADLPPLPELPEKPEE